MRASFKLQSNTCTVRIGNIPGNVGADDLRNHFGKFGGVVETKMSGNAGGGAEGGGGGGEMLVQFESRQVAERAIIQGKHVGDATLAMQWASANLK